MRQGTPGEQICPRCGANYGLDDAFCVLDGTPLTPRAGASKSYVGAMIAHDIELRAVLGVGAMGTVYRGFQRGVDRDVAVKILHGELMGRAQLVQRFCREAKIAGKLKHPHVVEVYSTGELPDGASYIVMEYLAGASLAAVLEGAGGRLSPARAISITLQICDATGEGHTRGIIHRDLKPENVMLVSRSGRAGEALQDLDWVKVLDFGIARSTLPEESMATAAGAIFGTARYISPECAQGTTATPASDVYSLGVMLYQMLAGRTPFEAEQPVGLLFKHVHEAPPALRGWPGTEAVPVEVERVVMACLAKDPAARPQDGAALTAALLTAAAASGLELPGAALHPSRVAEPLRTSEAVRAAAPLDPAAPRAIPATLVDVDAPPLRAPSWNPTPRVAGGDPAPPARPRGRAAAWIVGVTLTAVVLGGALGGGLFVRRRQAARAAIEERAAFVERTRAALIEGHYTAPPGQNVSDLVKAGLLRWPNDTELRRLRSDAEQEMITMAMTARSAGDIVGARDLARDAYTLAPTDNSARSLRAQLDDDLRGIASGATLHTGAARLVFESPPVVKPGSKVEMTCRIVPGGAGPKARIGGLKISLFPNGQTTGAVPITFTSTDPASVRAVLTAPAVGSYDLSFEAVVEGVVVRAMRDLDVAP